MAIYTSDAIVLKQTNFKESDKLLTVLTYKYGKTKAIVKGIRKSKRRSMANLEPGSFINIVYYNKPNFEFNYIKETAIKNPLLPLRNDIKTLSFLSYITDLTDNLVPEQEANFRVFNLLLSTLNILHEMDSELIIKIFEMTLLKLSGYEVNLDSCTGCDIEPESKMYYDFSENVLFCKKCITNKNTAFVMTDENIELINKLKKLTLREFQNISFTFDIDGTIRSFFRQYISSVLGFEIKSQKIVEEMLW